MQITVNSALKIKRTPFVWMADRHPVLIGGVRSGTIVLFTAYLLMTSLEVPNFLTHFFTDVANINLLPQKMFDRMELPTVQLKQSSNQFHEHILSEKETLSVK